MQHHEQALHHIARYIVNDPDCSSSVLLRQLLWSLQSTDYVINLLNLSNRLSTYQRKQVRRVIGALLSGDLVPADVERALIVSGEKTRWNESEISEDWVALFISYEYDLERLVKILAPGSYHAQVARILDLMREVHEDLRKGVGDEPNF